MSFFHSVRWRLTSWYTAILAFVLVSFGVLLYWAVRYQSLHHHDDSLRSATRSVISILGRQPDCATLTPDQIADLERLDRLVLVHELAGQGQVFYRSQGLDPALIPHDQAEFRELLSRPESFQNLETSLGTLRIYSVRYTTRIGRQGVVRVMDSLGNVHEALATLRWALLVMVPFSLLVAGAGGYWIAGRALRPVDEVTRLAREIEATNLSRRLPVPRTRDELGRLVETFNQMIDRLENAFDSMRRFTADASHELRTPLTIMRGAIDVALNRNREIAEYQQTLAALLEEVERLTQIVEALLFLARAEAEGLELRLEPTRLDELAADVAEAMKPLADARQIGVSLDLSDPVEVVGDERWLRQMLYNLVDNAIKHQQRGGSVRITVNGRNGAAVVSIRDTGQGLSEEERGRLFERFYRGERARSGGSSGAGLGLSIAQRIARWHGSDITVESVIGRGSEFRVQLPLSGRHDGGE